MQNHLLNLCSSAVGSQRLFNKMSVLKLSGIHKKYFRIGFDISKHHLGIIFGANLVLQFLKKYAEKAPSNDTIWDDFSEQH